MLCAECIAENLTRRHSRADPAAGRYDHPVTVPDELDNRTAVTVFRGDALCWHHAARRILPILPI